jgi:hypothetical protein
MATEEESEMSPSRRDLAELESRLEAGIHDIPGLEPEQVRLVPILLAHLGWIPPSTAATIRDRMAAAEKKLRKIQEVLE